MQVLKQATMTGDTTHDRELWCGLGRCGRCSCPSFQGQGNICEYCGHHYDDHGTSPFRASEAGKKREFKFTEPNLSLHQRQEIPLNIAHSNEFVFGF
jgi:hypothetical protein